MFAKGEYVVYGSKGVCQIEEISPIDIPGVDKDRTYYIMRPVYNSKGTVYLPIDSNKAVIRRIMTRLEVQSLLDEIPRIGLLTVTEEKKREECYKEALKTCSAQAWISIIKTLRTRRAERLASGKKSTALDERYLKAAEHELYGELSLILEIPKTEVETYIRAYLGEA